MRKNKRAKACEFNSTERGAIYERDNYKCIFCGSREYLGIAHLISRAKGGLGIRENGALACQWCHNDLDSGKNEIREKYSNRLETYLKQHYKNWNKERLVYSKWK